MKAAIFRGVNQPLTIEEVEIDRPLPREVVVRTAATGVCHSDLHFIEGSYPAAIPGILGHEPAGIVEEVGSQVTYLKPGDHVVGCLSVFCGTCEQCLTGHPYRCSQTPRRHPSDPPRLRFPDGTPIGQVSNLSAYAEKMLVHENALVKIDPSIPLDVAALVGCGVTTGLGAVFHTAKVTPGSTVAVFGVGGVGLAAVQGARLAGARRIIAVDLDPHKLETAKQLGATDLVDAAEGDPVTEIHQLTGGGVDFAFEAIGLPRTAEQAFLSTGRGGVATIIGMIPVGAVVTIPGSLLLTERKLQGSGMGSNRFRVDVPRYLELYQQGRLKLDEMITRRIRLDEINSAFDALRSHQGVRSVVVFD
ncbi:MAG: alcohol dehydrogenase [Dehalococcoidia bacterium]|nr:MAG: alcohol dehydrogenase [Dehalococcoidia bacterium]